MKKLILSLCAIVASLCSVAANQIDVLIEQKVKAESLNLSPLCDDATFIRRASLTLTGRLPKAEKAISYIESTDPAKKDKLIKEILNSEEFVDFWVLKWGDLLRIKSEFPSNLWPNAVQAYNRWLREQIRPNVPYNEMIYNLLVSSGSNFRTPTVNFYRAFQDRSEKNIADNVAMLFTGQRVSPTAYHDFFSQIKYKSTGEWKEEIVYVDLDIAPKTDKITMPDGQVLTLEEGTDFREPFAKWLTSKDNTLFAKTMANRVWFWIMGRGIIDPVDDLSPENMASNPELLAYLEKMFKDSNFDVKNLFYNILSSDAFARSSISATDKTKGAQQFAYFPTVRLTAEQLLDAIADITGDFDRYISRVPEPYSYFPADIRAVQLTDATVTSPQIELFGRPSRDVSLESDRSNALNSRQVLYLLNSAAILRKINSSKRINELIIKYPQREQLLERIYLEMLSRKPKETEKKALLEALQPITSNKEMASNLIWALINSSEFLFNH